MQYNNSQGAGCLIDMQAIFESEVLKFIDRRRKIIGHGNLITFAAEQINELNNNLEKEKIMVEQV